MTVETLPANQPETFYRGSGRMAPRAISVAG